MKRHKDIHIFYFVGLLMTILIGPFQFGWLIAAWNSQYKAWVIFMDKQSGCKGQYLRFPGCEKNHFNYNPHFNDYILNRNKEYLN